MGASEESPRLPNTKFDLLYLKLFGCRAKSAVFAASS